jgi:hypothetical protein
MPDADHCVFGPDRDRDVSAASSLAKSAVARRELYINVLFSLSLSASKVGASTAFWRRARDQADQKFGFNALPNLFLFLALAFACASPPARRLFRACVL